MHRCRYRAGRIAAVLVAAAFLAGISGSVALAQVAGEYPIKAAFLLNFMRFTEWPVAVIEGRSALKLCVSAGDSFGPALQALDGKTVHGKPISVERNVRRAELANCHAVFVADGEGQPQREILAALQGLAVLTVSDSEGFVAMGGMVELFTVNQRVQFEINNDAARRAGLQLSSHVLNLARRVH